MQGFIITGTALCALAAGPAQAEACRGGPGDQHLVRGGPGDQHLVRVGPGPAPLFFAMAWNGPPRLERAVAVR
jgi:hypothetical protein